MKAKIKGVEDGIAEKEKKDEEKWRKETISRKTFSQIKIRSKLHFS